MRFLVVSGICLAIPAFCRSTPKESRPPRDPPLSFHFSPGYPKKPHRSSMKHNPLLPEAKLMFQVSSNWQACTGFFTQDMNVCVICLYGNIWHIKISLGSPNRCLDSSPPYFLSSFHQNLTVHSSNLLCAETADAKWYLRTLTFHEDLVYAGARTCSREHDFVSLSPRQSHMPFHIFLQISLLSFPLPEWLRHISRFGSKFPEEEFTWFSPKVAPCARDRLGALLQQPLSWLLYAVGLQWNSCHMKRDLTGRSNSGQHGSLEKCITIEKFPSSKSYM